jgi:hypothetical protein
MLAVLDETYPELRGGTAYVVGAAVILVEENAARAAVLATIRDGQRVRPFHWHLEGPVARAAMIAALGEIGAVAHVCVHYPTARKKLELARARALGEIVPHLLHDGASTLLIESRGTAEDGRDRAVILDTLNALGHAGQLHYEWRTKAEPLLWLADCICGAVREHLLNINDQPFHDLRAAGVIDQLNYIKLP